MTFTYVLLVSLVTFILSSIPLFRLKSADGVALSAIYDFLWVLISLGALFLFFLTAGNQVLHSLESAGEMQRENESFAYRKFLIDVPLTKVCSEIIVLKSGESLAAISKARDEACSWATSTASIAQKLQLLTKAIEANCVNDDDSLAFGRTPRFNKFQTCGLSRVNSCAHDMCEYDRTLNSLSLNRYTNPMPIGFDSAVFRQFNEKLGHYAPTASLDSSIYKALKPIETGVFVQMWVWLFSVALGIRLAKGCYEICTRVEFARVNQSSWFRWKSTNWHAWKRQRKNVANND
ncbi:MAG: hypothetical protein HHJ15_13490 [Rhodoferax sp.]|uniref:hypothetical protein n=1 Tax=Rhodoferax sp. TaxID=50421 RepID=UPI0017C662E1|nr:hypothetical protein [Rhodoferax sp.]NMM20944.1 hypothetical protein [Rhodoferax sp.]